MLCNFYFLGDFLVFTLINSLGHFRPILLSNMSAGFWDIGFKGTVQPDWICMRVVPLESPLKGHQPLYVFDFLVSVMNIWNNFKVLSRFMQNWTQSPACSVHGLHRMLSSYWLAHFHLMKKSSNVQLYFGSVAEWWNFLPASRNPKNNWCLSRNYGTRFGEKDRGLSTYKTWTEQAGGLKAFLHGAV